MSIPNHNLAYRPLRAGTSLFNPLVNKSGTLGLIATSDGQDRWIVSCYHVLCRMGGTPFPGDEPIFQPDDGSASIATNSTAHADPVMDCAAAKVHSGIECSSEILGMPKIVGIEDPKAEMRVLKSGRMTGITEGVIREVTDQRITIETIDGFPETYSLSEEGDSGAVWVSTSSLKVIGLHTSGTTVGERLAYGVRISEVMENLGLTLAT
jgi:hypothetical protein